MWCCVIFQDGVDLMSQGLHKISLFCNVCLQIASSWARSPTNNINSFWKAWNMFSTCVACFKHCSTMHNMLLVIIDISSMTMTFVDLSFSLTLWGSRRTSKYSHVGMRNAVCVVNTEALKKSATTHVTHFYHAYGSVVWCIWWKMFWNFWVCLLKCVDHVDF